MECRVDINADRPPSKQLVEQILEALARGEAAPGERLPSVRALAAQALVNPNTVAKAYRELEALGLVKGRNGSGIYVTEAGPVIAARRQREETLAAFRLALRRALAAGHGAVELLAEMGGMLEGKRDALAPGGERREG